MASLYNDRFAFIHVPKTGGTWAMQALTAAGVDCKVVHDHGAISHVMWDEMPDRPFRFGFVRYPPTWYRSYFSFVRASPQTASDNALDRMVLDCQDFAEFVQRACETMPGFLSDLYERFLGPPGAIEFVGRYERLADDLAQALLSSGEAMDWDAEDFRRIYDLAPVNVSRGKQPISPVLSELILASESRTVRRFYSETVALAA